MKATEVDQKVINGIRNAVKARGEDWKYPNGRSPERTGADVEEWMIEEGWTDHSGGCYNLLPNGDPACIIGFVAVDQGLPTYKDSNAGEDAGRWGVSREVGWAMGRAQRTQDQGWNWGRAARSFFETLDEEGFEYE